MNDIKLIAVDMDGTFLKNDMTYNKTRFMEQYESLKRNDIRFVVASGNQYYQLKSFFPEIADEISFVAENGAFVVHEGTKIFNGEIKTDDVHRVMDLLTQIPGVSYILCGVDSAYIIDSVDDSLFAHVNRYYHRLKRVEDLYVVDDTIFKFALLTDPKNIHEVETQITRGLDGILTAVISGDSAIDLIIPGIHKASGIQKLQNLLGLEEQAVASFGDSHNDLEMLSHSHYSYAMQNAKPRVKETASAVIDSNNEEGVLNQIDVILNTIN